MYIYVIKGSHDEICGTRAFLHEDVAEQILSDMREYQDRFEDYYVDKVELKGDNPGRNIYVVRLYRGFDYGMDSIYDVRFESKDVYSNQAMAKTDMLWEAMLAKIELEKEDKKVHIYDDRMCSDDGLDGDWYYGDVFEDNFNIKISKLRLDKSVA